MVVPSPLPGGLSSCSSPKTLSEDLVLSRPSSPGMVESSMFPLQALISSDASDSSEAPSDNDLLARNLISQEAFRAAAQFTQNDRLEAIAERRKNQDLMNFFSAHGITVMELNDFISKGTLVSRVLSPQSPSPVVAPSTGPLLPPPGLDSMVSCSDLPPTAPLPPLPSSVKPPVAAPSPS